MMDQISDLALITVIVSHGYLVLLCAYVFASLPLVTEYATRINMLDSCGCLMKVLQTMSSLS